MNYENYSCDNQMSIFDFDVRVEEKEEVASSIELKSGGVELYNEDCLEILKTIPDDSIDLIVTDCPYHIVSGGCTNDAVKIGKYTHGVPGGILNRYQKCKQGLKNLDNNHISLGEILNDLDATTYTKQGKLFKHNDIKFNEWLPEVYRVLKENTHCYIMINPRNLKELWQTSEDVGFKFQNIIIWDKGNATPNKYYMNSYEMILMLRKGKAKNINNMGSKNILRVPNITRIKQHPTEKPVELMEILILNSSNEKETVLEPFMGAGATGVASKKLGRNFIGIEIDEKYFEIAKKRIEET